MSLFLSGTGIVWQRAVRHQAKSSSATTANQLGQQLGKLEMSAPPLCRSLSVADARVFFDGRSRHIHCTMTQRRPLPASPFFVARLFLFF